MSVEDEQDPVRVGRFEWERLMMMGVPHPQNLKLLPIGIFMSANGSKARPGNAGLALFGPHEKTWAKLLRWAVKEGWLVLVERGGARRGPGGATVVRASVYAASVPREVWERRQEILSAAPFRGPSVEGSDEQQAESVDDADGSAPVGTESMKGASAAPFNGSDQPMKGAPRDSVHEPDEESKKGAPDAPFKGFEGSVSRFEGSAQALPHHVVTSSTPLPPETSAVREEGRGEQAGNEQTGQQDAFAACQPLIRAMTDAGLVVSWQMQVEDWKNIARVVDRAGVDAMVDFARSLKTREPVRFARFYLKAGWLGLPPKSTKPKPPPAAEKPPYCGHIDCDEITRTRDHERPDGLRVSIPCPECHPNRKQNAA